MNISELTTTESRQLLLVHTKIDYSRRDKVDAMVKLIEERDYFTTEAGGAYRKALKDLIKGRSPIDCIYCGNPLEDESHLICEGCTAKLFERVNRENKDIRREKADFERASEEAAELARNMNKPSEADGQDIYAYAEDRMKSINSSDFYGSDGYENTEKQANSDGVNAKIGGLQAPLPDAAGKQSLREYYYNHPQLFTAVISLLIVSLMAVMALISINYGKSSREAEDNSASYSIFGMFDSSDDVSGAKETGYLTDGFELIGKKYTEIDNEYGEAQLILSDNTRYYPECGVSLVFNKANDCIVYIENDGSGTGNRQVPILGLVPGDSTVKAKKILTDNGLEINSLGDNNLMCQFGRNGDEETTYELDINYENDIIDLICVRIIM